MRSFNVGNLALSWFPLVPLNHASNVWPIGTGSSETESGAGPPSHGPTSEFGPMSNQNPRGQFPLEVAAESISLIP